MDIHGMNIVAADPYELNPVRFSRVSPEYLGSWIFMYMSVLPSDWLSVCVSAFRWWHFYSGGFKVVTGNRGRWRQPQKRLCTIAFVWSTTRYAWKYWFIFLWNELNCILSFFYVKEKNKLKTNTWIYSFFMWLNKY